MKSIIPTIRKECQGLNFHEWPREYQEKFLKEVAKDLQKEKLKTLKRDKAVSLRDKKGFNPQFQKLHYPPL